MSTPPGIISVYVHTTPYLYLWSRAEFTVNALNEQHVLKQEVHLTNRHSSEELAAAVYPLLPLELQQTREFASLKGS